MAVHGGASVFAHNSDFGVENGLVRCAYSYNLIILSLYFNNILKYFCCTYLFRIYCQHIQEGRNRQSRSLCPHNGLHYHTDLADTHLCLNKMLQCNSVQRKHTFIHEKWKVDASGYYIFSTDENNKLKKVFLGNARINPFSLINATNSIYMLILTVELQLLYADALM